jgi:RNA polymerase sigma-70 factor (ECF subfamily)
MSDEYLDELIQRLNAGDIDAAERAFLAYEPYLRMAVRRQLNGPLRSKLDSMDIVQSVWADVLCGFREAGWRFADRAHLRAFLTRVACNRLIDRRRQHHRALEREQPLTEVSPKDLPRSSQPRPSEVAQVHELWERMLENCPPAHREILILRRQGLPLTEIAARSGLHEGSVRRILYKLARRLAVDPRAEAFSREPAVEEA